MALVEFHAFEKANSTVKAGEGLYIYSGICKESIIYDEGRPLLRRLEKNGKRKRGLHYPQPFLRASDKE